MTATVRLRGITWDHPRGRDSVRGASAEWCAAHPDVVISWDARSLQAFADAPLDQLADTYDLLVIDHPHIPAAAEGGWLLPLDGRGRDADLAERERCSVGPSHRTYVHRGRQYGLAIDAAAQVAVYRPDLLAEPPRTWPEVERLARDRRVLWPAKPIDALSTFLTLAAQIGSPCTASAGVFVDRAAGGTVLGRMRALSAAVPAFCLRADPIAVAERLARSDEWAYAPLAFGYVNYAREGFRPRRLAYADIPTGPDGPVGSCLGGAGIAVSSRTAAPDAAVAFAFWLSSEEAQRGVYYRSGGQPAHLAAWLDPDLNRETGAFFGATLATLRAAWVRPRTAAWLGVQDRAGDLISEALSGRLSDVACLRALDALCAGTEGQAPG